LEKFPRSRAALSLLAYCYYHDKKFREAADLFERLTTQCPSVEDYQLYHIQSLLKIGEIEEADTCLARITKRRQISQRLLLTQVAVKLGEEDLNTCKALLTECVKGAPETICASAAIDFKEGKFDDALQKYSEVVNLIGFDYSTAYSMALCHYNLKQYSDASDIIDKIVEKSLEQYPEFDERSRSCERSFFRNSGALQESFLIEAYNLKASIEFNRNNFSAAVENFQVMPQRIEEDLDPVTLHNQALFDMHHNVGDSLKKLSFLLSNPPFPPETLRNLLTLYCNYGYNDIAAEILSDNAHLKFDLLGQNMSDYFDASIMAGVNPEKAIEQFETLVKRSTSIIKALRKQRDRELKNNNTKYAQSLFHEIRHELDFFLAVLMSQARLYWEREEFETVEEVLGKFADLCGEEEEWKINMAHSLFVQQGSKFMESISFYEPVVSNCGDESILTLSPIVLANLCVAYIMNNQNEEAEHIMKCVEKQESHNRIKNNVDFSTAKHHGCIINLVIGTLYCERENFEFGINRICKSLDPLEIKLGPDTWYYAKRCLMALASKVAKHMIIPQRDLFQEIFYFLDDVMKFGKDMSSHIVDHHAAENNEESSSTISIEALRLKRLFVKLQML
jgi:hypothetical protein